MKGDVSLVLEKPETLVASRCILEVNAIQTRVLSRAVLPTWERVNTAKHEIKVVKMYWSRRIFHNLATIHVKIVSVDPRTGLRSETHMNIAICDKGNPFWVNVWYGPTRERHDYNAHLQQECCCAD